MNVLFTQVCTLVVRRLSSQLPVIFAFNQWSWNSATLHPLSLVPPCQPAQYSAANTAFLSYPCYIIPPYLIYTGFQIYCKFLVNWKSRLLLLCASSPFPSDYLLLPLLSKWDLTYYVCSSLGFRSEQSNGNSSFLLPSVLSGRLM